MKCRAGLIRSLVALLGLVAGPTVLLAQFNITSTTPSSFLSGVTTNQTLFVSGTSLPTTFGSGNYAYCFYTGYGASSTPITPTAASGTSATLTIPASSINSIPAGAFVAGSFLAGLSVIPVPTTSSGVCTGGTSSVSNTYTVVIVYSPSSGGGSGSGGSGSGGSGSGALAITGESPTQLLQTNPATNVPAPPKSILISGSGFVAPTTVSFGWGTGNGSGTILYESSTTLQVSLPTIPAGVTSITPTVCNTGGTCVTGTSIPVVALASTSGTLSATPNPSMVGVPTTITGTITGTATVGAPSGVASVSVNGQAGTPAKVTLDPVTGTFVAGSGGSLNALPSGTPVFGDVNGDGIPDLVYVDANSQPALHVLLGNTPTGSFQADSTITNVTSNCYLVNSVVVADFNNDGFADVAVDCIDTQSITHVYVALSNGDGSFQNSTEVANHVGAQLLTGDMNHDGRVDLVVIGQGSTGGGEFTVYTGNGNGTFTASTTVQFPSATTSSSSLFVTDVDGDGYPDFVVLNYSPGGTTGSIDIYRNQNNTVYGVSGGSGANTPTYSISLQPASYNYGEIVSGDWNGDGLPDFALSFTQGTSSQTYGVASYVNASKPGTIAFTAGPNSALTAVPIQLATGDFNGDGLTDLAIGVPCTTSCSTSSFGLNAEVLVGDGTGAFANTYSNLQVTGGTVGTFVAAPLGNNAYSDLVAFSGAETLPVGVTPYIPSGKATVTLPYTPTVDGTSAITLSYSGDENFTGTSASLTLPVNGASVVVSVGSTLLTSQYGQSVTFTAAVSSAYAGSLTGLVSFYDGTTLIGQVQAVAGVATLTVSNLTAGAHAITAVYGGNAVFATGTSRGSVPLTVSQAQPTIRWVPTVATLTYGTALTSAQLDAVAASTFATSIPGTYQYSATVGQVLTAGSHTLTVTFTPTDRVDYAVATGTAVVMVSQAQPTITWAAPAPILVGAPLTAAQLNATASGPLGTVPGQFTYTPGLGTVLPAGVGEKLSVTFVPTDTTDYASGSGSTTITVIPLAIAQVSPASIPLGASATTVTLTGTGFLPNSVVQVNGAAVATAYVSATEVTATVPPSLLQTVQLLKITVTDPGLSVTSNAITEQVLAPAPAASFNGPSTAAPAEQPTLSFTLNSGYPVPLTGTLTLSFSGSGGVDDPSIQFASGGRTQTFTVPANSTVTPSIQIQSGTVAGTITVTLTLTAGGQDVTPSSITPVNITVPPSAPGITSATLTRSGDTLTVNIIGYSNSLEMTSATFQFTAASGDSLAESEVIVPAVSLFKSWYSNPASQQYGSEFQYSQQFQLSQSASTIGSVTVTLTNSTGTSVTVTAK